jgi:hypothetical protein
MRWDIRERFLQHYFTFGIIRSFGISLNIDMTTNFEDAMEKGMVGMDGLSLNSCPTSPTLYSRNTDGTDPTPSPTRAEIPGSHYEISNFVCIKAHVNRFQSFYFNVN